MNPDGAMDRLSSGDALSILSVVVVALAMAVVWLGRRNQTIQENRLDDLREANRQNAELVRETNKALDALTDSLRRGGGHAQ